MDTDGFLQGIGWESQGVQRVSTQSRAMTMNHNGDAILDVTALVRAAFTVRFICKIKLLSLWPGLFRNPPQHYSAHDYS